MEHRIPVSAMVVTICLDENKICHLLAKFVYVGVCVVYKPHYHYQQISSEAVTDRV